MLHTFFLHSLKSGSRQRVHCLQVATAAFPLAVRLSASGTSSTSWLHSLDIPGVDVREHGVEAVEACGVVLAEERSRLAQQPQAPDDLLPREHVPRVALVLGLRFSGIGGGGRGSGG